MAISRFYNMVTATFWLRFLLLWKIIDKCDGDRSFFKTFDGITIKMHIKRNKVNSGQKKSTMKGRGF